MFFPGNRLLLGRKTLSDIETATMPAIRDVFPVGSYVYHIGKHTISFPNGSEILLYGLDTAVSGDDSKKAAQKIKGLDLGGFFIDQLEEVEYMIYEQLTGRLSRNVPFHQACATINPANHWSYDYFKIAPKKNEILAKKRFLIETGMKDNEKNLPEGFIEEQMTKGDRYVRRFVLGEWSPETMVEGTVFEPEFLDKMRAGTREPLRTHGGIKIFEDYEAGQEYQIGVDPSLGDSDPCSIKVISKTTGREVASFNDYVTTTPIVNKVLTLCDLYNEPLVVPEVTGIGQAFIEEFRKRYDKIFIREVYNQRGKFKTKKLGFHTNYATKTQLIEHYRKQLQKGFAKVSDRETVDEFQVFTYSNTASSQGASAPHGYHDDNVMATLLAFWGVNGEGDVSKDDVRQEMIKKEIKEMVKTTKRQRRIRHATSR